MEVVARKVLGEVKAMVPGRFETALATPQTHPHVDWKAYYAVRAAADAFGFQHLADVDVTSVRQNPAMMKRAVLALFASDDGAVVLGHYRVSLRWTPIGIAARFAVPYRGDIFDVGTNFGGGQGVFLETTTAAASAVWDTPDFVSRDVLPQGTPLEQVVQHHRERVEECRRNAPSVRPTEVRTLQDVLRASDLTEQRKLAWRRERGWATRAELARLSKLNGPALDQLYDAFRNVALEESALQV